AVADNKDELHVLMTRTMERLVAVNESLAKNDETDSGDMMKVFAGCVQCFCSHVEANFMQETHQ
ncbi:hypothetical protein C0991_004659, partial [Blastosporella zonata]